MKKLISLALVLFMLVNSALPSANIFADENGVQTEETVKPDDETEQDRTDAEDKTEKTEKTIEESGTQTTETQEQPADEATENSASSDEQVAPLGTTFFKAGDTANDVSNILTNKVLTLFQNGVEVSDGTPLDPTKNIGVNIAFGIPVKSDSPAPAQAVKKGDVAYFEITKDLKIGQTEALPLMGPEYKGERRRVGTYTLETRSDKMVVAKVVFDGDDVVFEELQNVTAQLSARFEVGSYIKEVISENDVITVFNKDFGIKVPKDIQVGMTKEGAYSLQNLQVTWTVKIDAGTPIDLGGYKVVDLLKQDKQRDKYMKVAGAFVEGSLDVRQGNRAGQGKQVTVEDFTENDTEFSFVLPAGTASPVVFTYKTKVNREDAFRQLWDERKRYNKAILYGKETPESPERPEKATADAEVMIFRAQWIAKYAWQNEKGEVYWSVDINQDKGRLTNVQIHDPLPEGLELVNYRWYAIRNGNEVELESDSQVYTEKPHDDIYRLDTVTEHIRLKLYTRVTGTDKVRKVFKNTAQLTWKELPDEYKKFWKASAVVVAGDTGHGRINKEKAEREEGTGNMKWKITVPEALAKNLDDPKVYELFVHKSGVNVGNDSKAEGITFEGAPAGLTYDTVKFLDHENLRYIPWSAQEEAAMITPGLKIKSYPVKKDNILIGDLVEISRADTSQKWQGKDWTITLRTEPTVRERVFSDNRQTNGQWINNTAVLTDGTKLIDKDKASYQYQVRQLEKEHLAAENVKKLKDGDYTVINQIEKEKNNGYSHETGSIIFRISINGDNHQNLKESVGELSLKETLPEGWEFVPISPEKPFLIFKGEPIRNNYLQPDKEGEWYEGHPYASVTATGEPIATDTIPGLEVDNISGKSTAVFKFNQSPKSPYVIFLEAKPTEAKLKDYVAEGGGDMKNVVTWGGYFDPDKKDTLSNNLNGKHRKVETKRERTILLDTSVLKKEGKPNGTTINWTITYNPNHLEIGQEQNKVVLTDTLGQGMELRRQGGKLTIVDNEGNNLGNYQLYEAAIAANGTLVAGEEVKLAEGDNISYDEATRTMELILPEKTKGYIFTYRTDVREKAQYGLNNTVRVKASTVQVKQVETRYVITQLEANADYRTNASLEVLKRGDDGKVLPGATFTLTSQTGTQQAVETKDDGVAIFSRLQDGTYTLRETKAPAGYVMKDEEYTVVVSTKPGAIDKIVTINGEEKNQIVVLNSRSVGLTVRKTVEGENASREKAFTFTLTLSGTGADATYSYEKRGMSADGSVEKDTIRNGDTFTLKHGASIKFLNLPKGLSYTVTEKDYEADGYISQATGNKGTIADQDMTAQFVNRMKTINIPVEKVWYGTALNEVTVKLLANGHEVNNITLTPSTAGQADHWKGQFTNLPVKNADGANIAYSIKEVKYDGYKSTWKWKNAADITEGAVVTNTELTEVNISKKWYPQGTVTKAATFTLIGKQGDKTVSSAQVTLDGKVDREEVVAWKYTFADLPVADENGVIEYKVTEGALEGYQSRKTISEDGITFVNIKTTDFKVRKAWKGSVGDFAEFTLYKTVDGVKTAVQFSTNSEGVTQQNPVRLTKNNWEHTFTDLPMSEVDGKNITYSVEETDKPFGYKQQGGVEVDSEQVRVITNLDVTTRAITVTKNWAHPAGTSEPEVEVILKANDTEKERRKITKSTDFEGLRVYDDNGNKIKYTIEETPVTNYNTLYTGQDKENGASNSVTITNTITGQTSLGVTKTWIGKRPQSLEVFLYREGQAKAVGSKILTKENNWQDVFAGLAKYDDKGAVIKYRIEEQSLEGYEKVSEFVEDADAGKSYTFKNRDTEIINIPVEKIWIGPKKDSVQVQLLADGAEVNGKVITLNNANSWKDSFDKLPKYHATEDREIEYKVEELEIDNYKSAVKKVTNEDGSYGFAITNTNTEKIKIPVRKVWVHSSQPSVLVALKVGNDRVSDYVELNTANGWVHTFENLFKYDQTAGNEIEYGVEEIEIPNFRSEITGSKTEGFVVTNTYLPPISPYEPKEPETPDTPDKPKDPKGNNTPDPKDPNKPNNPHDVVPEDSTPQGDPKKPNTPETPKTPAVNDEEVLENKIPRGNRELPKTDGIPASVAVAFGLGLAALGLFLKRED